MPRTNNDAWDLATSVGATATMVAAARAVATRADNPLIDDPFAEPLVRAVGIDFFTRWAAGTSRRPTSTTPTARGDCSDWPTCWPPGRGTSMRFSVTRRLRGFGRLSSWPQVLTRAHTDDDTC